MALLHGDMANGQGNRLRLLKNTLANLAVFMTGTIIVAVMICVKMELGWGFVATSVASLTIIFGFVLHFLPIHPHNRFGYANLVTAFRASLASLAAAVVIFFESFHHAEAVLWALVGVVVVALALDGIDGYLARRFRQESELGARFDMEVDAYLILILSVAAATLDKAGAWVLLIGLMRYGFIAAGWLVPKLKGDLLPSIRRKAICVVQVAVLCFILMPWVEPPVSVVAAGIALAMLISSFALDVIYLLSHPARP